MRFKKAQIAMEVFAYVGFLILVFVLFSFYLFLNFNSEIKYRQYLLIKEQGEQLAEHFLFVLNSGPGTTLRTNIPKFSSSFWQFSKPYILIPNNGWVYLVSDLKDSDSPAYSFPVGFKNFVCGHPKNPSIYLSCTKNGNTLQVDLSKGWIFLNYTLDNKIEVE